MASQISLIIRNDTFIILESDRDPVVGQPKLEVLERIEEVLRKQLTYSKSVYDRYSALSEEALRGKLLEIALAIRKEYVQEAALTQKIFWKIFQQKSALLEACARIHVLVRPPFLFPLPSEMALRILSFLPIKDLLKIAPVNKKTQQLALRAQLERAREYGYSSQTTITVKTYLWKLLAGIEEYHKERKLPEQLIVRRPDAFFYNCLDTEATLRRALILNSKGFMKMNKDLFLMRAAQGREEMVFAAVTFGADVHARSKTGRTLLSHAAKKGQRALAKLLIAKGADVNTLDLNGNTPLMWTTLDRSRCPSLAVLLLEKGAWNAIDQINRDGYTVLHVAAKKNLLELVKLLVVYGADKTLLSPEGMTALELASDPRVRELLR